MPSGCPCRCSSGFISSLGAARPNAYVWGMNTVQDEARRAQRRALVIVNPQARSGAAALDSMIEQLQRREVRVEVLQLDERAEAERAIRAARGNKELLIVGGGDGTLNGLVEAVMESGLPLGVLPLGTANDLSRTLGLPGDPREAAAALAGGTVHRIDLGRVNGRYFFNAASLGLGVAVNRGLTKQLKARWGKLSYARSLLQALWRPRSFSADIVCDGSRHRLRCLQITVGNGRYYGGGMTVHRDAAIDDGLLDVYCVAPRPLWRLVRLLPALRRGHYRRSQGIRVLHGRRIEIATRRSMAITADGEQIARTPAVFEVAPAAVPVIVARAQTEGLKRAVE